MFLICVLACLLSRAIYIPTCQKDRLFEHGVLVAGHQTSQEYRHTEVLALNLFTRWEADGTS